MDVVDIAVVVVISAVASDFAWIGPDIVTKLGVVVVNTGVDYGDNRLARSGGFVPGFGSIDISIGVSARLPGVVHAIELGEAGVIRDDFCGDF